MTPTHITVSEELHNCRADKLLAVLHTEFSRAALEKLFDLHLVTRNNIPLKSGDKVRQGDVVVYDISPLNKKPEVVQLPVLFENEDVIVIDKPAGIISHARGKYWQEPSVASFIRDRLSGLDGERGGIVHRLDRATSGVMICAKHEKALKILQKQFHDRQVVKSYYAITSSCPSPTKAVIDAPIERNPHNPKQFRVSLNGKTAQTEYELIDSSKSTYLLRLVPKTGRTHQLRLHLQFIKCPILGDVLYGGNESPRLMLHASSLKITLPDGSVKEFFSSLPKEFIKYGYNA